MTATRCVTRSPYDSEHRRWVQTPAQASARRWHPAKEPDLPSPVRRPVRLSLCPNVPSVQAGRSVAVGRAPAAHPTLGAVDGAEGTGDTPSAAVLVPIKSFRTAKARLAPALGPTARAELARRMARTVIAAAGPLPVTVVCDDPEVASWALAQGAAVVSEPGRGLNGAVAAGVAHLERSGVAQVIVAHADLPGARQLAGLATFAGITLVPDRRDDGTNVICLPAGSGFRFAYGPGSFQRHLAEARRLHVELRIVHEPGLAWDVDIPDDLLAELPGCL